MKAINRANIIFGVTILLMMICFIVIGFAVMTENIKLILDCFLSFMIFGFVGCVGLAANWVINIFEGW